MYTLDEIIASISQKPFRTGFGEVPSDSVDAPEYLQSLFGPTDIRTAFTTVPLSGLRVLQPAMEMWRYMRLCTLSHEEFDELMARQPLSVVRGRTIEGYPLLQGNHRALYALMHGIDELPATIHLIADEFASLRFASAALQDYHNLDTRYGRHDVLALREAYKDFLGELLHARRREIAWGRTAGQFRFRSKRYVALHTENDAISAKIPCISLDSYIKTIHRMFGIPFASIAISEEEGFYRNLVMTQKGIERAKLQRIAASPELLDAPLLLVRTRLLDYVVAGHTRLRARLDAHLDRARAIVLQVDSDRLNGFLDTLAQQAGYLAGSEGIRRLEIIGG